MRTRLSPLAYSIIFMALGVFFLVMGVREASFQKKAPVDLYEAQNMEPGMHVVGDVALVWDTLYSETTTNKTYGITTSSHESGRGYVIPIISEDDDTVYIDKFVCMKVVRASDYPKLERIMDETNDWWYDETGKVGFGNTTYHIDARVVKMDKDELEIFQEYLGDYLGMTSSEVNEYMLPYVLKETTDGTSYYTAGGVLFVLGAVILTIILIVRKKKSADSAMFQKSAQMYAQSQNDNSGIPSSINSGTTNSEDSLELDFVKQQNASSSSYGQSSYGETSGSFGGTTNTEAQAGQTGNSIYGQPASQSQSTSNSIYGAPVQNANAQYGQISSIYNQQPVGQSNPIYGQPAAQSQNTSNSIYGQPVAQPQNTSNPLYGATVSQPQSTGNPIYGAPIGQSSNPIYGQPQETNKGTNSEN